MYRTTAVNGSAIATVTTVFKPLFAKTDRFITYNNAYDSSCIDCSPSRAYKLGSNPVSAIASFEFLAIQVYLLSGYIVSAPDYEGPDAAFTPGYLSGMGVLDSMRAVLNFGDSLGLSDNPMIAGVGYSGGGLATGWAAAMQPSYAPELPLKAWMAGGIPANLTAILEFIDGTVFSGFAPIAIAGMLKPSAHGAELKPLFDRIATPLGQEAIDLANKQCVEVPLIAYPFQSILGTEFQTLGRGLLSEPTIGPILKRNTLGVNKTETPSVPVMMYHGQPDEIVPYAPAAALNEAWCNYGASIKFTDYAAGGHGTTAALGFVDALNFAKDAFAGKIAPGCTKRTVLNEQLSPLALGLNLEP
ncbi:MAG: lipase family protein, partial [Candidatus Binatia bacterium]